MEQVEEWSAVVWPNRKSSAALVYRKECLKERLVDLAAKEGNWADAEKLSICPKPHVRM